ncbi:MAG TPA: Trk system potassium transporter TrkA [Flavobacteriaceae bacterium]|jgi:trk system potassium uptake protein TrkA|nr:Trk system potassium transporter TrkA [Flavobacteriaceae bacterium]
MRIIIAGAGEVGFHLAKLLSFESHDITLIDEIKERLTYADTRLDIRVMKANATSISKLKDADVANTDLVIAVTSNETVNITICVLAKRLGAKRTIARINNSEFIDNKDEINFAEFGIDELISTEELATKEIKMLLNQAAFNHMHEFEDGELSMLGIILSEEAPFVGMTVMEAATTFSEIHFMPIAIQAENSDDIEIPRGNTVFKVGDLSYFITLREGVSELYKLTGKTKKDVRNVMIVGGSSIGKRTAKELCDKKMNIKIIEINKAKAFELADDLPNALVVLGDGRDLELLLEENIEEMDVFIGATDSPETNIMTCLVAKSKGVSKTIALAENVDYSKISHSIGIDTIINKKLLAANSIFRYIRKGDVLEITTLNNLNAEILEFQVRENSKITKSIIRDLDFPRHATIGGVIRDGKGYIALGGFKIQPGDKVVVSCLADSITTVETFFD